MVRLSTVRIEPQRFVELFGCFRQFALSCELPTEICAHSKVLRSQPYRLVKLLHGLIMLLLIFQGHAELPMRLARVRFQLQGLLEKANGFGSLALVQKRLTPIRERIKIIGSDAHCFGEMEDRFDMFSPLTESRSQIVLHDRVVGTN